MQELPSELSCLSLDPCSAPCGLAGAGGGAAAAGARGGELSTVPEKEPERGPGQCRAPEPATAM